MENTNTQVEELSNMPMWEMETSETIGAIGAALAKAQGMMTGATKGATNPHFGRKYSELADVIDVIREPLSKNEIAFVQGTSRDIRTGEVIVTTQLIHSSGEWIKVRLPLRPVKDDPQGDGSAITYARRYSLMGITGVAPDDDDGNAASGNVPPNGKVSKPEPKPAPKVEPKPEPPKTTLPEDDDERAQTIKDIRIGWVNLGKVDTEDTPAWQKAYGEGAKLESLDMPTLLNIWRNVQTKVDSKAK